MLDDSTFLDKVTIGERYKVYGVIRKFILLGGIFFFFLNRGFESPLSFFWALLWGKICVDLRWFLMQRIERSYYWKCW